MPNEPDKAAKNPESSVGDGEMGGWVDGWMER
jgi:hypothetical protein